MHVQAAEIIMLHISSLSSLMSSASFLWETEGSAEAEFGALGKVQQNKADLERERKRFGEKETLSETMTGIFDLLSEPRGVTIDCAAEMRKPIDSAAGFEKRCGHSRHPESRRDGSEPTRHTGGLG